MAAEKDEVINLKVTSKIGDRLDDGPKEAVWLLKAALVLALEDVAFGVFVYFLGH